jgi:hypothetical protein
MKSLSARIMKLLLGPGVTVFCRTVSSSFVFVSGATLAGVRLCRKERASEGRLVAPNSCSAAQQITCADTKGVRRGDYMCRQIPTRPDRASSSAASNSAGASRLARAEKPRERAKRAAIAVG